MTPNERENTKHISAVEYLRTNFNSSDRLAILARSRDRGKIIQRIATSARIAEPAFQEWLRFKNERESCDIYLGMNSLKPEARGRTKVDIQSIRHLYLDIDVDGPSTLDKIQKSNLVPPPNYTLSTSPDKFQLVWRVENVSQEQAELLQRAMAREFGGDPAATDSTRVLRLPGFLNRKYDTEFRVHAEKHTDHIYHLQDFCVQTAPIDPDFRPRHQRQAPAPSVPRQLTQSEHDWAYAKRALARGDHPDEVIRRIADFRAGDKSDPVYYARHTVGKAQAQLASERRPTKSAERGAVATEKWPEEIPPH
jgi:RepB DNA-primase from phage plasmid